MQALHIFKTGRHTDANGTTLNFSAADLIASAQAYDPALHEAPIVIGHPKSDAAPAYGWVSTLEFKDSNLFATPTQLDHDFSEMITGGKFKKRSASFYPPNSPQNPVPGVYYLRHIGFLGAQPPAIKGLKDIEFAEDDECVTLELSFSESHLQSEKTPDPVNPVTAFFDGLGAAIKRMATVTSFSDELPTATEPNVIYTNPTEIKSPANPNPLNPDQTQTQTEETPMTPDEIKALQDKNAALEKQIADSSAAQAKEKLAAALKANQDFAEQLTVDKKLAPADKALVVAMLDAMCVSDKPLEFGEGEGAKPLIEVFKDKLSAATPNSVLFSEHATKPAAAQKARTNLPAGETLDAEDAAQHAKIQDFAEKNQLSFADAAVQLDAQLEY